MISRLSIVARRESITLDTDSILQYNSSSHAVAPEEGLVSFAFALGCVCYNIFRSHGELFSLFVDILNLNLITP